MGLTKPRILGVPYTPLILPLNDVFQTIQGEGEYTGKSIVMVRLQGCLVGCPWCDTKETWELDDENKVETHVTWTDARDKIEADDMTRMVDNIQMVSGKNPRWGYVETELLAQYIKNTWYPDDNNPPYQWVIITGGEPGGCPLPAFVRQLRERGMLIGVEVSGFYDAFLRDESGCLVEAIYLPDWITVAPKLNIKNDNVEIKPAILERAGELKFPVGRPQDIEKILEFLEKYKDVIYDSVWIFVQPISLSPYATEICINACHKYGWRLSLQTQHYIGIP